MLVANVGALAVWSAAFANPRTVTGSNVGPAAMPGQLNGVSCPSATDCFAVGEASKGTLVERWNGRSWRPLSDPTPGGAVLLGVSCATSTFCMAVGRLESGSSGEVWRMLAQRWDGTRWTIVPLGNAGSDGQFGSLASVSCTSVARCFAVGYGGVLGFPNDLALSERWDGRRWSFRSSDRSLTGQGAALEGVACASNSDCLAVGTAFALPDVPEAEHWNGTTWLNAPIPYLNDGVDFEGPVTGVDCAAIKNCIAVSGVADVGHWNGSHWSKLYAGRSPSNFAALDGVSCPSPFECFAVGGRGDPSGRTLVVRGSPRSWSAQPNPDPAGPAQLAAISCATTTACMDVGVQFNDQRAPERFSQRWDGTRWTIVPS
jgi:hypothetical protein